VLDSGAFIESSFLKGVTTPGVAKETKVPADIEIREPRKDSISAIEKVARETGDLDVLSPADREVLALAYEMSATLVTNDFAVQNVASRMKIDWESTEKGISRNIKWEWYCPACWKKAIQPGKRSRKGVCEFCGTETKRRPAKIMKSL